jgi:hypothetical protein
MRPRERRESGEQELFRSRLEQIIDTEHALVKLARTNSGDSWKRNSAPFTRIAQASRRGGACDPQAHLQPQRRGRVRAMD